MGIFDRKSLLNPKAKKTDVSVDLTEQESEKETAPPATFGQPTRCPECEGRGYLDRIDLVHRVMFQHCLACNHKWEITEAELSRPA